MLVRLLVHEWSEGSYEPIAMINQALWEHGDGTSSEEHAFKANIEGWPGARQIVVEISDKLLMELFKDPVVKPVSVVEGDK